MNRHPRVGLGPIFRRDNQILLLKRKGSHGAGTWGFPGGGHLEWGENFGMCVERESKEEIGVVVANFRVVTAVNNVMENGDLHYVTVVVEVTKWFGEPEIKEPDKAEALEWFPMDSLPSPLFEPLENFLREYDYR